MGITPGSLIDRRFEVQRLVGSGGMGAVYRARDRRTGGPVAVKVLHERTPALVERFEREALVLAGLAHPAIVGYVAHGALPRDESADPREPEPRYLVMEWLDGVDLAERLAEGPLAPDDALALGKRVASALAAAHELGVVHRDLKPSNVLLEGGDPRRAKLVDFGVAGGGALDPRALTRTGTTVGTPGFMAPEQIRGERALGPAVDVYALGCVLFTALVGREPWGQGSVVATLARVLLDDAPRLREQWPDAPVELDELLHRMLARDAARRPRDGDAVLTALRQLDDVTASTTARLPSRARTLGAGESRLVSAVLVMDRLAEGALGPRGARAGPDDETLVVQGGATHPDDDAAPLGARLAGVARSFGAELEVLHASELLALVRGTEVATDQAVRAARCALALREAAPHASLAIVTGRGATGDTSALGHVTDRALGLLEVEGPHIWLDEQTARLVEGRMRTERVDDRTRLVGEHEPSQVTRPVLGRTPACVGRERELAALHRVASECFDEPGARACVLVGGAGFGKSRLRLELLRRLEAEGRELEVWYSRGDSLSANAPLGMVGQLVRAGARLTGGEPLDAQRLALAAWSRDASASLPFVLELAGLAEPRGAAPELDRAREDPALMSERLRAAFEGLCAERCRRGPLVLVLEDLHWGDLSSARLVESAVLALAERPLLVIATGRPELHEVLPSLFQAVAPCELRVGRLSPRAAESLVRALLPEAEPALVERLALRADGHALWLEELARAVVERGGDELPDTVLAMVQARAESLPASERRALRAASVLGRRSWDGAVATLLGCGVDEAATLLSKLAARDWLSSDTGSRFSPAKQFSFKQDVAREAAYAMLTEADRALGHRLAAAWLERAGEREALVLARHFERGGEHERAAIAYGRGAHDALASNDLALAVELAERAYAANHERTHRGLVRAIQAEAHLLRGETELARTRGAESVSLAERGTRPYCRAVGALAVALGKLGDREGLVRLAGELDDVPVELRTTTELAAAVSPTVVQLLVAGERERARALAASLEAGLSAPGGEDPDDVAASIEHLRVAVASFEAAFDPRLACSLRKTLGWYLGEVGDLERARRPCAPPSKARDGSASTRSCRTPSTTSALRSRGSASSTRRSRCSARRLSRSRRKAIVASRAERTPQALGF